MGTTVQESEFKSTGRIDQCIKDCLSCYEACLSCISHCLALGGKHSSVDHIQAMMECSLICNTSATMMRMNSAFSNELCQMCAKICDVCEESCRTIDDTDRMMEKCADACAKCAESCRSMSH